MTLCLFHPASHNIFLQSSQQAAINNTQMILTYYLSNCSCNNVYSQTSSILVIHTILTIITPLKEKPANFPVVTNEARVQHKG